MASYPKTTVTAQPLLDQLQQIRQQIFTLKSQVQIGKLEVKSIARQLEYIENALEHVELQQSLEVDRDKTIHNVAQALGSSLDLETVINQVMDSIIRLTGAERCLMLLYGEDGTLRIHAARNFEQETLDNWQQHYSRTVVDHVLKTGKPLVIANASEEPVLAKASSLARHSMRSIMAVPLQVRGRISGVVYVDSLATVSNFSQQDLQAMDTLTIQAAVAIENARLFDMTDRALRERIDELRLLRHIDLRLSETLETERIQQYTLEWMVRLTGATSAHFVEPNAHGLLNHPLHAYLPETVLRDVEEAGITSSGTEPRILTYHASADKSAHESIKGSALVVPIRFDTYDLGTVILWRPDQDFTPQEHERVMYVIARAAVALDNARLYTGVKNAELAKSEFVEMVAHDLRTPLSSIDNYAELIELQDSLTERQREYLERMQATIKRTLILVSDLADINRLDTNAIIMEPSEFEIETLLEALRESILPHIEKRHHQWIEEVAPVLPRLYADFYRLLQVLINLVSNAYKYTPDGGMIRLEIAPVNDHIRFSVSDNGIGISVENLKLLGTKFWRAPDTFTRSQVGSGLGFAITRKLVEQMGSQIEIHSVLGKGSTFSFELPMLKP
jgi:signal transduction histidine kinase